MPQESDKTAPRSPEFGLRLSTAGLVLVCLAWVAVIWLWEPAYLTLAADDSFYYLQIARNVAAGNGFTFDGLNLTNGFHPLWLFVASLLARLFQFEAPDLMRLFLSFQVGLVAVGISLLARMLPRHLPRFREGMIASGAVLLLHFYFTKILVNGMESALLFLLMAATLWVWTRPWRVTAAPSGASLSGTWAQVLGALAALTVLARVEAMAFALPIVVWPLVFDSSKSEKTAARFRIRTLVAGAFALPLAAFFLASRSTFGHWLPVSGAVKAQKGLSFFDSGRLATVAIVLVATAVVVLVARRVVRGEGRSVLSIAVPVGTFAIAALVVQLVVVGNLPAIWYLVPWAVLLILGGPVCSAVLPPRHRRWLIAAAVASWGLWSAMAWIARLDPSSYSAYLAARRNGAWLRENSDADSVAAGWACGIAAAHSDRTFVNLDGLVNSWTYKEEFQDQHRTDDYINNVIHADYIVQYYDLEALPYFERYGFRGVPLSRWFVARAECVRFNSIVRRSRSRHLVYAVLQRQPDESLPRFSELPGIAEQLCADL